MVYAKTDAQRRTLNNGLDAAMDDLALVCRSMQLKP
jgi:hypothetical protein